MTLTALRTGLEAWLAARTARERRLLTAAAAATLIGLAAILTSAISDDLSGLRVRIAARERELATVRTLAARLGRLAAPPVDATGGPSLLARLEHTATEVITRDRIASMTPAGSGRIVVDIRDASLRETVALLHALETATAPLPVVQLTLRRHPDDPTRLGVGLEVSAIPGAEP